jgi:hypothetical protein
MAAILGATASAMLENIQGCPEEINFIGTQGEYVLLQATFLNQVIFKPGMAQNGVIPNYNLKYLASKTRKHLVPGF